MKNLIGFFVRQPTPPLIVELNGMSDSGLFASNPTQVVTAVVG